MTARAPSPPAEEASLGDPSHLWKVAVEAPLPAALTYRLPRELLVSQAAQTSVRRGLCVTVPLGRRKVSGVLLGPADQDGSFTLKDIIAIDSQRPRLPESFLLWLEWLAHYYIHPIGQVVALAYPPLAPSKKTRKSNKSPIAPDRPASQPPILTAEQARVIEDIRKSQGFDVHLVHGVTGSGKTEIYMRLMEEIVQGGKQGIVLVPEISLTPQLIDRFTRRLGNAVAVIHSHLTPREKTNQWWAMIEGGKQVLIGARSALFCPLPNLGMIVIDEEHEASFKQEEKLKYHARDAAVMLGKFSNCPVVLGSATPSLETWHNAIGGRYRLHQLKVRVAERSLPEIQVVDLRSERDLRKQTGFIDLPFWLGKDLYGALDETLKKGEQSALFLNRRGIAQAVVCPDCGYAPECPNCAVKLTLHGKNHLLCHYCDFHQTLKEQCPDCPDGEPKPIGLGTEMIENGLRKLFPGARITRMDRDEITTREDLERAISEVENREVDILVGTQMIAKGLDFPGLTLVGLVMADVAFHLPDVRASERSFQLLTQVSGRAGRHLNDGAGRVIIQTYSPDHPSIRYARAHDFEGFAHFELGFREALRYPPFWRLASFRIQGLDLDRVKWTAQQLRGQAQTLRQRSSQYGAIEILGPAPAPLVKLRNQHRWRLLVKAPDASTLGNFCRTLCQNQDRLPSAVKVIVDIDAVHML